MGTDEKESLATALNTAIWREDLDVVRQLLDAGADPNGSTPDNFTPLRSAASRGFAAAIRLLLERGADPHAAKRFPNDGSYLQNAAQSGSVEAVRLLIDAGLSIHEIGSYGWTPLAAAATQNRSIPEARNAAVVAELIARGSDVNTRDKYEKTPLHQAAQFTFAEAIRLLIASGADPNAVDKRGSTPLHYALPWYPYNYMDRPVEGVVRALLAGGAQVNAAPSPARVTPLHIAAARAPSHVVGLLIQAGADVNAATRQKRTPLTEALGNPDTFALLLDADADVAPLVAAKGKPALISAAEKGNRIALAALLAAGADVNAVYRGRTALHLAVKKAHTGVIEDLLKNGADHRAPDNDGMTALDLGRKRRRKAVRLLLEVAESARIAKESSCHR
ncbi:MAG: ankyrin repeat domain-containing protein [Akkermansiaceae bacterium]|nr:ankyrin repeat domain-containing protein [Armatimonadota bacterium]